MRRVAVPFLLILIAILVAACGESEKDKYIDDYKPLNEELLNVGEKLSKEVQGADQETDAQLEDTFQGLAKELERVGDEIADLDTPDDLKEESEALTKRIDAAVAGISAFAKAAGSNAAEAEAAALVALGTAAVAVNRAQNELAKATGAAVGKR